MTDVIDEWDHRFLVEEGNPLIDAFRQSGDENSLVILEYLPTSEVMSVSLKERLIETFPDTVSNVSVSVLETGELCATY